MSIPLINSITSIKSITTENRREIVQQSLAIARVSQSVYTAIFADSTLAAASHADVMRVTGQTLSPIAGLMLPSRRFFRMI